MILVSGGLGFIGSHTSCELLNAGYEVIIVDNLYNSQLKTLDSIKTITGKKPLFFEIDVNDSVSLEKVFMAHKIEGIIHFSGYKAVGESVSKPLMYYRNNLLNTITLAELAIKYHVPKFIFSSSATVYGNGIAPFKETSPLLERTNPYGESKAMNERILTDTAKANKDFNVVLLRYFNPVGAHSSGLIGEVPNGTPNNLMPYIAQVGKGIREKLNVFGNDYNTVDGTGVRDYIHVVDLAKGHLKALEYNHQGVEVFNLGTGKGTSVLEIINAFTKVNGIKIPYEIVARRDGDIDISYADVSKAKRILGFEANLTIEDMVRDAWQFEYKQKK